MLKFGIYTSFYNVEKYVDRVFKNVESINYENFEWVITDDFSTDNTRSLVLNKLKNSPIKNKIKFVEQSEKQEMYWKPNLFFDNTFDWIVLLDSDDLVDRNCLMLYNNILNHKKDVTVISSDFHKINETDNSLHSISYVINDDMMSKKIYRYHPTCDYLNNISYSCFGHLRAFKNNVIDKFEIKNNLAGAEDSYRIFWLNSYGKYLNIPRPLYRWYLRTDSISHNPNVSSIYNDNFDISLNKLNENDYGVDPEYNDLYIETCSLGSYEIGGLENNKVSLWTRSLSDNQKERLEFLYFDVNLTFNNKDSDIHIVSLNYFNNEELEFFIGEIKNKKVLFYYQNQKYHSDSYKKDLELETQLDYYKEVIGKHISYNWWTYIRHFVIKN
jgi:glycosyltransferase involved in cell wall biosynthesis